MEPEILKRGKEFHRAVQLNWKLTNKDGQVSIEHTINLTTEQITTDRIRRGRLDILVDEIKQLVGIVEIKSTNWDTIKPGNITSLLNAHCRQIWKYITENTDGKTMDVCPGIVYPASPTTYGLKERIEQELNENGIQVVWFNEPFIEQRNSI